MIQELNGKKLDNQYHNYTPRPQDFVISLRGGEIMLGGERDEIRFPRFSELLHTNHMLHTKSDNGLRLSENADESYVETNESCVKTNICHVKTNECLSEKKGSVTIHQDDESEEKTTVFQDFADMHQNVLPVNEENDRNFRYLFAIDDDRYFLTRNLSLPGYHYEKMQYLRTGSPKESLYAGLLGLQLGRFYEALRFCGRCGHEMCHSEQERMMYCPECGLREYPKICPCVIVGVVHDGKILVSQYRGGFTDHYALIAGFAEAGETIEECVAREVYEETHVHVKNLQFYKSQPWPFSDSLLFGFFCELDGDDHIVIEEDELAMAKWVSPEEIYEEYNDYSLTNEMLCKFKNDYGGECKKDRN